MAAAAVAPVAVAATGGDLATPMINLGGGIGGNYLTSWLYAAVQRVGGGREITEAVLREVIADELATAMQRSDGESAALREGTATMLEALDALHVVLKDTGDEHRRELVTVLSRVDDLPEQLRGVATQLETSLQRLRAEWLQESRQTRHVLHHLVEQSDAQLQLLRQLTQAPAVPRVAGRDPYPGLAGFQTADSGLFFGRDDLVATLRTRLLASCMCVVTGESGSGKSSLLRAGLPKGLARSPYDAQRRWQVLHWTVADRPVDDLGGMLARAVGAPPRRLVEAIEAAQVASLLAARPFDQRLVIVADQFERIFTRCSAGERSIILKALLTSRAPDHPMVTIVSVRADFLSHCVAERLLADVLEDQQIVVGPMRAPDIRAAVELPARAVGVGVEPALVDQITADAERWPRSLPLIAHALREVWKRRTEGTLRRDDYRAIGGIAGAISSTADSALDALADDQRVIARRLVTQCVDIDPDRGTHTSRPIPRKHLAHLGPAAAVETVREKLRSAAVISLSTDDVELTHEALITEWPTLRRWVDEDAAYIKVRSRLRRAAREWESHGHHVELLYGTLGMAEVETLLRDRHPQLAPHEEAFVQASQAALAEATAQRKAAEEERHVAVTVQRSLLPFDLPQIDGVAVAISYVSGSLHSVVGGDWYEVIATDPDTFLLVVGDVAGSGLAAIPLMAQLRVATRAYAIDVPPPDRLLSDLHNYLRRFPADRTATTFAARISVRSRQLQWSSAAHPDAHLWTPTDPDRTAPLAGRKGPALGSDDTGRYALNTCRLPPGARLLVFTGNEPFDGGERTAHTAAEAIEGFAASNREGSDLMTAVQTVTLALPADEDRCVVAVELQ